MKLPVAARDELRRQIREHPRANEFVPNKSAVSRLAKSELLEIANQLGINAEEIVETTKKSAQGMEGIFEPEELETYKHSERHPAFKGTLEFPLKIEMFGKTLERRARLTYEWTPEWDYFDLIKKEVTQGWEGSVVGLEILAIPEGERWTSGPNGQMIREKNTPTWTKVDIFAEGILTPEIWEMIDTAIDEKCREEDKERRKEHRLS